MCIRDRQTQVKTVIPYFEKFIKEFPNLKSLAKSSDHKILKNWEGLGYYSRARNLKKTAIKLLKDYKGELPEDIETLKSLPGIGEYTSRSILAIAHNKPYIPMDGNVERILKRVFLLKTDYEISKENLNKKKSFFGFSKRSSDYAQALMELGALICKPTNPNCNECPLAHNCKAFKNKNFDLVKFKKKDKETFYKLNVYKKNNHYLLIKNNKFNFLKNFNIFPMEEVNNPKNFDKDLNFKMSNMSMNIKIEFKNKYNLNKNNYWIDPTKLQNYTLPTFTKKIVKFLESHK